MLRWFRSLFAWRLVKAAGVWGYEVNTITRQRRAVLMVTGGYSPVDFDWLNAGEGHPEIDGQPAWRSAQGQQHTPYFL